MEHIIYPWQFALISLAGWMNRQQRVIIDYLIEENRILKEQLRGKRPRLYDDHPIHAARMN